VRRVRDRPVRNRRDMRRSGGSTTAPMGATRRWSTTRRSGATRRESTMAPMGATRRGSAVGIRLEPAAPIAPWAPVDVRARPGLSDTAARDGAAAGAVTRAAAPAQMQPLPKQRPHATHRRRRGHGAAAGTARGCTAESPRRSFVLGRNAAHRTTKQQTDDGVPDGERVLTTRGCGTEQHAVTLC
jgi:hypothetical protein